VNVRGALLYMGDGHAAMGDGEVAGTAVEVPLRVRMRVSVIKGKKIDWPRFENADEIMAAGIYRPLDDSLRIAFTQLIAWIHADYGLSELDAYELLSKVAKIHVTEMVDPNYVIIAKIDKKIPASQDSLNEPHRRVGSGRPIVAIRPKFIIDTPRLRMSVSSLKTCTCKFLIDTK
jgi:acetamidase/formamidase